MPERITYPPLTEWSNEPTVDDLRGDLSEARNSHSTHEGNINTWLDNLHVQGSAKREKKAGRSNIQPKLILKQAEWRYASLSEPFLNTDNLFTVSPVTYEDKRGAEQNALMLNHQFNNQIDKVKFIDSYIRTAVNEGTVITRLSWDSEEVTNMVTRPTYEIRPAATPEQVRIAQTVLAKAAEDPDTFEFRAPAYEREVVANIEATGQPYYFRLTGSEEVEETYLVRNQPHIEVCDYRNVYIDPYAKCMDEARFVIYTYETTLADLRRGGDEYSNLDLIDPDKGTQTDDYTPEYTGSDVDDSPRKKIVAYEYWGEWDIEDNGETTAVVATFVGDVMIKLMENPFPKGMNPFDAVSYLPVKDSPYGQPDGALLEDNQKVQGAIMRGMIDTFGRAAVGQKGIRKDALDLVNQRRYEKGRDYFFNPNVDPRSAIIDHGFPELPASAQYMLALQNNEAESLTGVRSFAGGISGEGLGEVATGVRGALDAASKRELGILRRLVQGIVSIGKKLVQMNAEFLSETEIVRITNSQFVRISKRDLAGNFDLRIDVTTIEEDNQKAQELAFMLQTLGNNVDGSITRMILSEIAKLRKMPTLAERIENFQPEPDPLAQREAQLRIQLLEAQLAQTLADAQGKGAKAQLDSVKVESELAKVRNLDSESDLNNLEYIEQESGTAHQRDLEVVRSQAQSNLGRDLAMSVIDNQTSVNQDTRDN